MKSLQSYHRLGEVFTQTVKKWRLWLIIFVIGSVLGVIGANLYMNKMYKASYDTSSSIILEPNAGGKEADPQNIAYYMNTYKMALGDPDYLNKLVSHASKSEKKKLVTDVSGATVVDNPGGTTIITIKVTSNNAKAAVYSANYIAKNAVKDVSHLMKSGNARVLTSSKNASLLPTVNKKQILVSIVGLVFVLSALVTFMIVYFDPTVQGTGIIKDNLNNVLLTTVPNTRELKTITLETLTILDQKLQSAHLMMVGLASDETNKKCAQLVLDANSDFNSVEFKSSVELSQTGVEFASKDGAIMVIEEGTTKRRDLAMLMSVLEYNLAKPIAAIIFIKK
ncbi:hypothetical protein [Latilactobacillus curvatus]|uniref:hypothetical protein n=1 Tax=Latilactobacillus curvatus TaxID=28038 RepID=UPI00117BC4BB|nr:hypothetical protein [Latilactobacillus curvatus]